MQQTSAKKWAPKRERMRFWPPLMTLLLVLLVFVQTGCRSPSEYRTEADRVASDIITEKQKEALGRTEPFGIERPSDILRRRLLEGQDLAHTGQASLGTDQLEPIKHWPEEDYPRAISSDDDPTRLPRGSSVGQDISVVPNEPIKLSLMQALQVGARNSPEYQSSKEDVFRAALALDLERNDFRNIFTGQVASLASTDASGSETVSGTVNSADVGLSRTLQSGVALSTALAADLASLLTQGGASSLGLVADASISIPLLRGSGKHIVREPLTQAERNVVYAIYDFERYKRTFAVNVARSYLSVLQQQDQWTNAENNYESRIVLARRSRRLADAGRLSEIDVDRAVQSELGARNSWILAEQQYKSRLDEFKSTIGLPTDALIELDPNDLEQLQIPASKLVEEIVRQENSEEAQETPPADAPAVLIPPSDEDAGPLEIDESTAIRLALDNRLDLRTALGEVYDAQRQVVVQADRLRGELTLLGSADIGASRDRLADATDEDARIRFDQGSYSALLTLDLPLERTAERNAYRDSFINLEQAIRNVQTLEDQIKLSVRGELRDLLESRESLKIQTRSVVVADKRVRSTNLFLEAGRAAILDMVDAQDDLLLAQNSLTRAVINYRIAELEVQRDMGLLQVDESGLWREFSPEVNDNVEK